MDSLEPGSASSESPRSFRHAWQRGLWRSGILWLGVGVAIVIPVTLGIWAASRLMRLGDLPDCQEAAWSDDLSSSRLYCADDLASKQTVKDLQNAIALADSIPVDDPLRTTTNQRIWQWSQELLHLADAEFQQGNLEKALDIAREIPARGDLRQQAVDRIQRWKAVWERAETIYDKARRKIDDQNWGEALNIARGLLQLGNEYWETTKYRELTEDLEASKEHQLSLARKPNDRNNLSKLFPTKDKQDVAGMALLSKAKEIASSGKAADLKAAIAQAEEVSVLSSAYAEAQRKIDTWRQQTEAQQDRQHLDRAIQLASRGDATSLQAGIDEAYRVSPTNALYEEARRKIEKWTEQLYRVQYPVPVEQSPPLAIDRPLPPSPVQPVVDRVPSLPSVSSPIPTPSDRPR